MPRRWSKLQHRLQEIFAPNIRLQFHCAIYRIPGHVDTVCPRYFLMLNSEIIWDWPGISQKALVMKKCTWSTDLG